jgi:eukaryotic-like serine/threonine-protein kinase
MEPGIGSTLDHYRLETVLGAGAMGTVYLAWDSRLCRPVAVKVLAPSVDDPSRQRARHEALTLSLLNHPNIATVLDFGTDEDVDFLVMEYVPGTTLDSLLVGAPLDDARIRSLGWQLARGLAAAHAAGVIHRDIKPSNLRVSPGGVLKIIDFGVATCDAKSNDVGTTRTGERTLESLVGTLQYMSPERLRGASASPGTDIFSAGVVLYQMASGRVPFEERQPVRLIELVLNVKPVNPRLLNAQLSSALDATVMRALEKDPSKRFASAAELGSALGDLGMLPSRGWVHPVQRPAPTHSLLRWAGRIASSLIG